MYFFDTHAHLDDEQFENAVTEVLARAGAAGVGAVVAVGTTFASSRRCVELATRHETVFAAVGIQPNYTAEAAADDWDGVQSLLAHPRVVAVGETGIDHYWDYAALNVQRDYFGRHIEAAQRTGLPLVIHMREADGGRNSAPQRSCAEEILELLTTARRSAPLCGVMHSYTGSSDLVGEFVRLGFYISFAGMLTYKKSAALREIAATVPGDRLLIETDAPYLSPHPCRGHRPNEPSLLVHTATCLAEARGVPLADLAQQTTLNACRLFKLQLDVNTGVVRKD